MLTINLHKSNHRNAIVTLCAATLLGSFAAGAAEYNQGQCTFAQELTTPYNRVLYLAQVNRLNQREETQASDVEAMYGNIKETSFNGAAELDEISANCIACHDGMSAKSYHVRVKNSPNQGSVDLESVLGSHPIGMDYANYSYSNRNFKKIGTLSSQMIFVDGKVGCITCHNPLNPEKNHLVMDNSGSRLCFSCHNK